MLWDFFCVSLHSCFSRFGSLMYSMITGLSYMFPYVPSDCWERIGRVFETTRGLLDWLMYKIRNMFEWKHGRSSFVA